MSDEVIPVEAVEAAARTHKEFGMTDSIHQPVRLDGECSKSIAAMRACGCLSPEEANDRQRKVWESYEVVFSR